MTHSHINLLLSFVLSIALGVVGVAAGGETSKFATLGEIERVDARFDQIVPKEATIEKLGEGYEWSEGPVWDKRHKWLLFSDIPNNAVMRFREGQGVDQFLQPAGYTGSQPRGGEPGSNGLLIDGQGRLVLCQHGDRRIARLVGENKFETLADRYDGKRFNSPNDGVFKRNGDLYFTDPPYGLLGLNQDPAKELDFNGVYRLSPDGYVTLLTKEMTYPNGIGFSPDEKTLYVAQSDPAFAIWKAFEVLPDGTLGTSRVFFDATDWAKQGQKGLPDGLKVDHDGNIYATGPGGVHIFAPDGTRLGTFRTGEATANCGWGDDGHTLYITADMYLCRVKLKTKGLGF